MNNYIIVTEVKGEHLTSNFEAFKNRYYKLIKSESFKLSPKAFIPVKNLIHIYIHT